MHKAISLSALALLLATPTLAQSKLDNLREALAAAPDFVLTNPAPFQFSFFDRAAWAEVTEGNDEVAALTRINFGGMIAPLSALRMGGIAKWQQSGSVLLDDISWLAGFGSAPNLISYWGFSNTDVVTTLIEDLQDGDFEYVGESDILGNGEAGALNFDKRDPSNPWRGEGGQANFIHAADHVVLQSSLSSESVESLRPVEDPLVENIIVSTAVAGLGEALPGDAILLQATLISPILGLDAIDPMEVLSPTGSIEETKAKLEAAIAAAGQGIPPYLGGLLADIDISGSSALAISLSYPNCDLAGESASSVKARWDEHVGADLPLRSAEITVTNNIGLCAATIVFVAEDSATDLSGKVYERILFRNFPVLQIGTAS